MYKIKDWDNIVIVRISRTNIMLVAHFDDYIFVKANTKRWREGGYWREYPQAPKKKKEIKKTTTIKQVGEF